MKYSLRFVWYVLRIVIIAASAFAILVVAFFMAMDSANVYVVVTDGMKAKATAVLMPGQEADLAKFFSDGYLKKNPEQDRSRYADFVIKDFDYKISVDSLWCNPWKNTATVTVVESIPSIASGGLVAASDDSDKPNAEPPPWPRAKYKILCIREDDVWRIDSVELAQSLPSEPTPSPEPSAYITASPVPTATPKPSVTAATSPEASASASSAPQ
jgi:hypothetical protein